MKITLDQYGKIRKLHNQGESERSISEALGVSAKTVRRYRYGEHTPGEVTRRAVAESGFRLEIKEKIKNLLEDPENENIGKHSRSIKSLWREVNKTTHINYTSFNRYYHEVVEVKKEVFIPLDFDQGEVMQVDWFETKVKICHEICTLPIFIAVLAYSRAFFCAIMPDMTFESFISGHIAAFDFFGGVAARIFYDNLRAIVLQNYGINAVKQDRFKIFESHYGFEAVFMNKARGNEKGIVEKAVQTCRDIIFTPVKELVTFQEMQDNIVTETINYLKIHKFDKSGLTIYEKLLSEKQNLLTLPVKDFSAVLTKERVVDKCSMIQFDTSFYSVPGNYVGQKITILVYPYTIECWYKGQCIAKHNRSIIKNNKIYIPSHFIDALKSKPRAIGNAAPLKYGILSPEMSEFLSMVKKNERNYILFDILKLESKYGADIVSTEIKKLNLIGSHSFSILKSNILVNYDPINCDKAEHDNIDYSSFDKIKVNMDLTDDYDSISGVRFRHRNDEKEDDNGE
jgi:transposase